jgi:hypothetical protein
MTKKLPYAHTFWEQAANENCENCSLDEATHDQMPLARPPDFEYLQSFIVDDEIYYVRPISYESNWRYEIRDGEDKVLNPDWPLEDYSLADLEDRVRTWR